MRRTLGLAGAGLALLIALAAGPPPARDGASAPAAATAAALPASGPAARPDTDPRPDTPDEATVPSEVPVDDSDTTVAERGAAAADGGPAAAAPEATADATAEDLLAATFVVAAPPTAGGVAGAGARVRYTVEVAPTVAAVPEDVAAQVRAALHDPRSWARDRTLEQVADPTRADIRVVLADPATVDTLCGRVGLDTAGIYSCWNGRFAALNAWRWEVGAEGFDDLDTYRTYLVNHEFGHGLGRGHVGCPSAGALAPVMMQQSKGLAGCLPNGWPYPPASPDPAA